MERADVDALGAWERHTDPLFRHYNLPPLPPHDGDELWAFLSQSPRERRAFAGTLDGEMVATLMLRLAADDPADGELGIMLDPAYIGRGLGRRILGAFVAVLEGEGFRRLHLEASGYNGRAIAAYRANGFVVCDEYWAEPEPGVDVESLLEGPAAATIVRDVRLEPDGCYRVRVVRMERRLRPR